MSDKIAAQRPTALSTGDYPLISTQELIFFAITVLGFSFWFFMALPFASHRESYHWLAVAGTEPFTNAFGFKASTYRPLFQAATWLGFLGLDPHSFPTSALRQSLLQLIVYALFMVGWWLIYSATKEKRLFALIACITGAVFFSAYVQLFHIYGIAYGPVVIMLGILIRLWAFGSVERYEIPLSVVSTILVLWHPFATALFIGFYFGHYVESWMQYSLAKHVRALCIILVGATAVICIVAVVSRFHPDAPSFVLETATKPLETRLLGLIVSYQTNEVNGIASAVALALSIAVVFSLKLAQRAKILAVGAVLGVGAILWVLNLPLLWVWIAAVVVKLVTLRLWSLLSLTITASLLPFGGSIGTPMYALFAIIMAAYVTALGWSKGEETLCLVSPRWFTACVVAGIIVIVLVREGVSVPVVTKVANPLLAERERTFQLEHMLWWLHSSKYCHYDIAFAQKAGSPIDSVEDAVQRINRPPSAIEDVNLFWNRMLRCRNVESDHKGGTVIMTFGGPVIPEAKAVFEAEGRYGGDAKIWARE